MDQALPTPKDQLAARESSIAPQESPLKEKTPCVVRNEHDGTECYRELARATLSQLQSFEQVSKDGKRNIISKLSVQKKKRERTGLHWDLLKYSVKE